jgi:hypothetical protein
VAWLETSTWGAWLCTERVRDLLLEEGVEAHFFPVLLRVRAPGQQLEVPHTLVVFDALPDMIDLDRSAYACSSAGRRSLARVALTDQAKERQSPLFLGVPLTQVLVHARLRARLEAAHLEGVAFASLEMVHHPWAGAELDD